MCVVDVRPYQEVVGKTAGRINGIPLDSECKAAESPLFVMSATRAPMHLQHRTQTRTLEENALRH